MYANRHITYIFQFDHFNCEELILSGLYYTAPHILFHKILTNDVNIAKIPSK